MSESAKYRQIVQSNMFQGFSLEQLESQIQKRLLDQGVDISKFSEKSFPTLVKKLVRFLVEYDIDYNRFVYEIEHPESPTQDLLLKGLCLVDMWIEATKPMQETKSLKNYKKLRSTIDRFKFLCIVDDPEAQKFLQLSKKVLEKAKNGSSLARIFDPDASSKSSFQALLMEALQRVASENVDTEKTEYLNQHIWEILPQLKKILEKTGNNIEAGKLPFGIHVINLTKRELQDYPLADGISLNYTAFVLYNTRTKISNVYLSYDSLIFENEAEHEVMHALSLNAGQGLTNGMRGRMSRGPNEAITEAQTSRPLSYPYTRFILGKILEGKSELEQLVYKAYYGLEPREKLTTALFNLGGSNLVIKWDFMMSQPQEIKGMLESRILFDFEEFLEFFTQGVDYISLKTLQQTKQVLEKIRKQYKVFISKTKLEKKVVVTLMTNYISIIESLKNILVYLENTPIKDVLEINLIRIYNASVIQQLQSFEFVENETVVSTIAQLNALTALFESKIQKGVKAYWTKNNKPPIFEQTIIPSSNN